MTWTCHICGDERTDDKISVYTSDLSLEFHLPAGVMKQNVRYCNDRPLCVTGAKLKRLVHDSLARKAMA